MMKKLLIACCYCLPGLLAAQNTVGLISYDPDEALDGYNLYFPHGQNNVYLLDNCGRTVHTWQDSTYFPGNSVYLEEDGSLFKCGGRGAASNPDLHAGGGGEVIEHRAWDNTLLWRFTYNDSTFRLHHDIAVMSNGNVLAVAWEKKSMSEAIAGGRDTSLLPDGELWPEHIIEVEPAGIDSGTIVWEWHAWEHLIQDYDSTKANFGIIANHPELIDLNYPPDDGDDDWMHVNAIDYNETLDQIMISVPTFNEMWIIDHTTTTAEAASHSGGLAGKGGDLIYRWGNPEAFGAGDSSDQKLFFQHDSHWIDIALSAGDPDFGKIAVFNNRVGSDHSSVGIINPVFDSYYWEYPMTGNTWGPADFEWEYKTPDSTMLFSIGLSGLQRLKNGNTLICVGRKGYFFEINPQEEVVWEYINPMINGSPVSQGDTIPPNGNIVFRMNRYPSNYPAFTGKTLDPIGYIELNPDTTFCPSGSTGLPLVSQEVRIYPNPARNLLLIQSDKVIDKVEIFDFMGRRVYMDYPESSNVQIISRNWPAGAYFVRINDTITQKVQLIR